MVRALLDGTKTQTRRPYKARKHPDFGCEMAAFELAGTPQYVVDRMCPYGQPGDRLWVRETHRPIFGQTCGLISVDYQADPREKWERLGDAPECLIKMKWTPSIHMRREYSRILLEVVSVRVERLQDISEADAIAEGIERSGECNWRHYGDDGDDFTNPVRSYRSLWEQINGTDSWAINPWVWVVEFKRVKELS